MFDVEGRLVSEKMIVVGKLFIPCSIFQFNEYLRIQFREFSVAFLFNQRLGGWYSLGVDSGFVLNGRGILIDRI